jgi:hypothetical protein
VYRITVPEASTRACSAAAALALALASRRRVALH